MRTVECCGKAFTGVLKREGIAIIMDGRGRALDNIFVERLWRSVKYEDVYMQGYGTVGELTLGWRATSRFTTVSNRTSRRETGHCIRCTPAGEAVARRSWTNLVARGRNSLLRYAAQGIPPAQGQGSAVLLQVKSWMQLKFRKTLS